MVTDYNGTEAFDEIRIFEDPIVKIEQQFE